MKPLILIIFSFFIITISNAQTDTEFWFAAPEVTYAHSGDTPILFRIATGGQPATVTIDQPANLAFTPIVVTIPANSTISQDLSAYVSTIENLPPDQVLNYGLHIVSTTEITVYYEVNTANNPEIFPLKGRNALGTTFLTPFQTVWTNGNYNPAANSAFVIIATENNTTVTITPSQNIAGHTAGTSYTITLNKGQTYSGAAVGLTGPLHPSGTIITADKPIAVTVKDDSVQNGGSYDLMGDQLVPTDLIGTEYVVMRGYLYTNAGERVFILATQNNTDVLINGALTTTLSAGQTYAYAINIPVLYIQTTQPVYVLHVSGFGNEMGEALLPKITCSGSSAVSFIRSTSERFALNIVTHSGNEGNFTLNGSTTLVPASAFNPVPGTNGNWVAAQIEFLNIADIPVGGQSSLSNSSGIFQLGMINGGNSSGCRYGYFSSYSQINLGPNASVCPNDSAIIDAGIGYDSYLWSTGDTTQTIAIPNPGTYWVTVSGSGCTATDTIDVLPLTAPILTLGQDTAVCSQNDVVVLDAGSGFNTYLWNTGDTTQTVSVGPGTYIVTVTNAEGCSAPSSDSATVVINAAAITLANDTVCNPNALVTIDAGPGYTSYSWSNGADTQLINVLPGNYIVTVTNTTGCQDTAAVSIFVQPAVADFYNNLDTTITNVPIQFADSSQAGLGTITNWFWDFGDGSTFTGQNPQHAYTDTGLFTVSLIITNSEGCTDTITSEILVIELPVIVPNAFTPNGDGVNDVLVFGLLEQFNESKLWVYNRWGTLVYQSNNYKNNWDGGSHTAGVYYFILEVNNLGKQKFHGTVTMLK